jgi:hypothetical protein
MNTNKPLDLDQAQEMLIALGLNYQTSLNLIFGVLLNRYVLRRCAALVMAEVQGMNVQQYIDDLKLHTLEKQIAYLQAWAATNPKFSPLTPDEWSELNDLLLGKTNNPERKRALIEKAIQ